MKGLRSDLKDAAIHYADELLAPPKGDPLFMYTRSAGKYIDMALHMPNLFRFVYMNEYGKTHAASLALLTHDADNMHMRQRIIHALNPSPKDAMSLY